MNIQRVVQSEALDHLAPSDPVAMRSRNDLVRVHRAMGTRGQVARGWQPLFRPSSIRTPLRVLELGAGDGRFLLGLARSLSPRWPQVQLDLLDQQPIVTSTTLAAFASLGWSARVQVADVRTWAASSDPHQRWDLITATLFLHHFERQELDLLLTAVATRCDRFFVCEPRRSWMALAGSHLIGALGVNAVTRSDAVLSVRAGFCGMEISARWPTDGGAWQTREYAAGPFSHCFSAVRSGMAP
jgi:hypothetical protein